jgi:hypothetical protein
LPHTCERFLASFYQKCFSYSRILAYYYTGAADRENAIVYEAAIDIWAGDTFPATIEATSKTIGATRAVSDISDGFSPSIFSPIG